MKVSVVAIMSADVSPLYGGVIAASSSSLESRALEVPVTVTRCLKPPLVFPLSPVPTTGEGQNLLINLPGSDPQGLSVRALVVSMPTHGALYAAYFAGLPSGAPLSSCSVLTPCAVSADNAVLFVPPAQGFGVAYARFDYAVTNGILPSNTSRSAGITVNGRPSAAPDFSYWLSQGGSVSFGLPLGSDPEFADLAVFLESVESNGTGPAVFNDASGLPLGMGPVRTLLSSSVLKIQPPASDYGNVRGCCRISCASCKFCAGQTGTSLGMCQSACCLSQLLYMRITYRVRDAYSTSSQATVMYVYVEPVAQPPEAGADVLSVDVVEGVPFTFTLPGSSVNPNCTLGTTVPLTATCVPSVPQAVLIQGLAFWQGTISGFGAAADITPGFGAPAYTRTDADPVEYPNGRPKLSTGTGRLVSYTSPLLASGPMFATFAYALYDSGKWALATTAVSFNVQPALTPHSRFVRLPAFAFWLGSRDVSALDWWTSGRAAAVDQPSWLVYQASFQQWLSPKLPAAPGGAEGAGQSALLYAWGENSAGQLALGVDDLAPRYLPVLSREASGLRISACPPFLFLHFLPTCPYAPSYTYRNCKAGLFSSPFLALLTPT